MSGRGRALFHTSISRPDLSAPVLPSVEEAEPEVSEEPFVAPPGLAVPADVELVSCSRAETDPMISDWKRVLPRVSSRRLLLVSALQSSVPVLPSVLMMSSVS